MHPATRPGEATPTGTTSTDVMSGLDPTRRFAHLLPSQVVRAATAAAAGAQRRAAPAGAAGPRASDATALQRAAALAMARVRHLPPASPATERRMHALRGFLEAMLLHTWGERLARDPGFPALLDGVVAGLQSDAELARMAETLGVQLCERCEEAGDR